MKRLKKRAFIDATLWVFGWACVFPHATGDGKALIGIVYTGVVALGTLGYSRSVGPGMIFLATTALGAGLVASIIGIANSRPSDIVVLLLAIFAFTALSKSVLDRGRANVQSFKTMEKLSEKTEVVELLLKDYEAQATEWLWQSDVTGKLTAAPELIVELLGGHRASRKGQPLLDWVGSKISPESRDDFARMAAAVRNRVEFHDISLAFPDHQSGGLRWVDVKGRPQFDDNKFQGFRGIVADNTQAVMAEQQVQFLAAFDSLTGLFNRNSVHESLAKLNANEDKVTAFLIDLDGFKQINDSYGHDIGDKLLRAASKRLTPPMIKGAWAARLAGDEFLVVVPDQHNTSSEDRLMLAQDICDRVSEPFQLGEFDLQISASVGMARFPSDTDNGDDLLSLCDLALYDAKESGRDRARPFRPEMLEGLKRRIVFIERLKQAVHDGQISLHYQPQHCLSDGSLIGFEALARWTDDDLGVVGPDVFIPIAEQTGLIVDLGERLLRRACMDAFEWYQQMGADAPVVSVNISPVQFARTDVSKLVALVLEETGLPAELLEIEVTEGVLISDQRRVANTLTELSMMGVSIALDDFGTGYSSLSYLKALPLNRLKIDRSFVNDLDDRSESPIVGMVVKLGQSLDLQVIAEGVETECQIAQLIALGCDEGQGYHYSRPMPIDDARAYVRSLPNAYRDEGAASA